MSSALRTEKKVVIERRGKSDREQSIEIADRKITGIVHSRPEEAEGGITGLE